jgi:hypothetical protein
VTVGDVPLQAVALKSDRLFVFLEFVGLELERVGRPVWGIVP